MSHERVEVTYIPPEVGIGDFQEEVLSALQARLGVTFRDETHLRRALRHRSASLDQPRESNERMEFLGDSIVGMVICDILFARSPDASEGELAKAKAYLVSEPTLAEAALALGLDTAVEVSASEEAAGGKRRPSTLSDAFEAVVAAIYLDQGVRAARRFVRRALMNAILQVGREEYHRDFKSLLQERLQAEARKTPHYRIVSEIGADHDKTFVAHALAGEAILGEGAGKSKKQAEQAAALAALENMKQSGSDR